MGTGKTHVLANLKKYLVYKNGVQANYLGTKSPLIMLNFMKPVLKYKYSRNKLRIGKYKAPF